ncbi:MAG: site-specific DNA-methyltransferase [Clostridia bacterium]|nr:site-specific DNA-methyltransferase [Clostridia bacterium]
MNFSEMSKEELIEYIKSLDEQTNGKYGLVWDKEKEPEKIVVECDKKIPILKEIKKKAINNGGQNNILIEGDNFHALSVLNYTHKEAIDVIYIDPPYNTGNQDFMYNDKFVDNEDGYKHSKWLNFMEKRLMLSRGLLKETGIIFISIDDNEAYQLKIMCDKIFGVSNFVANFIRKTSYGEKTAKPKINKHHDYCLCYSKNISAIIEDVVLNGSEKTLDDYSNPDNDSKGDWKKDSYLIKIDSGRYGYARYPITNKYLNITHYPPVYYNEEDRKQWHYVEETFRKMEKSGQVVYYKTKEEMGNSQYSFYIKKYKSSLGDIYSNISTVHFDDNEYTNSNGSKVLIDIIGKDKSIMGLYPKPVSFIKKLVDYSTTYNKNATVLDFFAGSGTTGQAVMELNAEDGGNRKFILCTNNENGICEEVTYPRLKTVITGKRQDGSKYSNGLKESLKYYKTDFVENSGTRDQLYYDLTEKCIPMLCVRGDTYNKVKVTEEYTICANDDKSKYSCIYFDILGQKYDDFLKEVKKIKELKQLYIFNLGDSIDKEPLKEIENYVVEPIPYKIIELYKKVVKMSKGE